MQHVLDTVLQFGQFSMVVIGVCIAVMVLVSIIDRHPRDSDGPDDH